MVSRACNAVLGIMLVLVGAGCASSSPSPTSQAGAAWGSISPSLVLPGMGPGRELAGAASAFTGDSSGWEYSRNDDRLSVGHVPPASQVEYVEVETRERLRTNNGRPRDHSTTRIHSIRRRLNR